MAALRRSGGDPGGAVAVGGGVTSTGLRIEEADVLTALTKTSPSALREVAVDVPKVFIALFPLLSLLF